jgi:hypothetical protein
VAELQRLDALGRKLTGERKFDAVRQVNQRYDQLHREIYGTPAPFANKPGALSKATGGIGIVNPNVTGMVPGAAGVSPQLEVGAAQHRAEIAERARLRGPNTPDTRIERLGQPRVGRTFGEWAVDVGADLLTLGASGESAAARDVVVQKAIEAARNGQFPSPQFSKDPARRKEEVALLGKMKPWAEAYRNSVVEKFRQGELNKRFGGGPALTISPTPGFGVGEVPHPAKERIDAAAAELWKGFPAYLKSKGIPMTGFSAGVAKTIAFEQAATLLSAGKTLQAAQMAQATNLIAALVPELKSLKGVDKFVVGGLEELATKEGLSFAGRKAAQFAANALRPQQVIADAIIGEAGAGASSSKRPCTGLGAASGSSKRPATGFDAVAPPREANWPRRCWGTTTRT